MNGIKGRKDTQQLFLHNGRRVVTDIRSKDVLKTKTWWEMWGIYVKSIKYLMGSGQHGTRRNFLSKQLFHTIQLLLDDKHESIELSLMEMLYYMFPHDRYKYQYLLYIIEVLKYT